MDFIEFKIWKLAVLALVVFLAVFLYGLFTGKDLRDKFRDPPDQS